MNSNLKLLLLIIVSIFIVGCGVQDNGSKKTEDDVQQEVVVEENDGEDASDKKDESDKDADSKDKKDDKKVKKDNKKSDKKKDDKKKEKASKKKDVRTPFADLITIREKASVKSKDVGIAKPGQKYNVIGQKESEGKTWLQIDEGWVIGYYFEKFDAKKDYSKKPQTKSTSQTKKSSNVKQTNSNSNKASTGKSSSSTSKPASVGKTEKASGDFMSKVSLNVRKGPGTNNARVGVLNPGEKATVTEKAKAGGSTWYKLKSASGVTGWSSSNYLVKYQKGYKPSAGNTSSSNSGGKKYNANTLYFGGTSVPYKAGGMSNGQAIIDGGVYASTWGGTTNFSGTDGKNTHFIGHNPGVFSNMHTSNTFIVTDSNGTPFTYVKTKRYVVNEWGINVDTGENHYDRIAGTGGGERIILQSTVRGQHPKKWIVEATPQ